MSASTLIALDANLVESLQRTLQLASEQLADLAQRETKALQEAERNQLLNEVDACAYLKRDSDTLLYYRKRGLPYYKRGNDVWYRKGEIDDWLIAAKVHRHSR
ncbi:hypothetical protein [Spirosoma fluminis]